jgi:hypothetical protein
MLCANSHNPSALHGGLGDFGDLASAAMAIPMASWQQTIAAKADKVSNHVTRGVAHFTSCYSPLR